MELSNIVYSSTLIFLLILCALLIVGFLLLQSRKAQLSFSEKKTKTRKISSLNNTRPVIAEEYHPGKYHSAKPVSENNKKIRYYVEEPLQSKKISKNSSQVKPVSRGSLVREQYNSNSFHYSQREKNKDIIRFK